MLSADQVPVKSSHSKMPWPKWVVLIARSTGSALRAVCPFQPSHHVGCPTRSLHTTSHPKRGGLSVTASLRHQSPGDPRELVGECNSRNLRRPPCQQCHKPGPMLGPMDFGIADDGERSGREQATQIAIPSFADVAKLVLASARILLRNQPDPG